MKIQIKNFTKKIKNDIILNNINYTFEPGKIYGLVGKNGSGKTMLLKAISGFLQPTSGFIIINDKDIYKTCSFPEDTRVLIGNSEYISDMTGFDNLLYLAKIKNKIGKEDIDKAIKVVNLEAEVSKKVSKYSLGMKQKLGIAQVIMEYPKIMLLDEPFNGIDNSSIEGIKSYLNYIKKDTIIIIATHYKEDINNFCDVIINISNGEIIAN